MSSSIIAYLSLVFQVVAAVIAISLFKRTKYNSSWILISVSFILMVFVRLINLFPIFSPKLVDTLDVAKHWLDFIISLTLLIGVFFIHKIFQYQRRVEEFRKEMENNVLSAVMRTEEKERQRFAKELHDGLGPLLSVVKMLVSGLETSSPEMSEKIRQNLKQTVDEAIESVREISVNISPHILNNFGLKDAVDAFIKKLRASDVEIVFTTNLGKHRFNNSVEVIMYRVICELVNNTIRHAKATRVDVDLQLRQDILYLEYKDNGIGFNVDRSVTPYGMGLDNMQYRLNSNNGGINITSEQGDGMHASANIKVK